MGESIDSAGSNMTLQLSPQQPGCAEWANAQISGKWALLIINCTDLFASRAAF